MEPDADVARGACKYSASCHCSAFVVQPDGYCGSCSHPYCVHPRVPAAPPQPQGTVGVVLPTAPPQPQGTVGTVGVVLPAAPPQPEGTVGGVDMATVSPELRAVILRLQHQCAEAHRQHADSQRQHDEVQRQCAEAQRQLAEAQRQLAEAQRQHAEAQRQLAEAQRQHAEAQRQLAEAQRQHAEAQRQLAEAQRQHAEAQRQLAEAQRQHAEAQRQLAEAQRQHAEAQRQLAEAQRQHAEAQRQLAEAQRQHAEAQRQLAEAQRQHAEAQRQLAEAQRQRAEAQRQRAEAQRRADEGDRFKLIAYGQALPESVEWRAPVLPRMYNRASRARKQRITARCIFSGVVGHVHHVILTHLITRAQELEANMELHGENNKGRGPSSAMDDGSSARETRPPAAPSEVEQAVDAHEHCDRLRTLCRDPRFWGALRVFGDRQALLLTRAPYLGGATTSLEAHRVTDAALCSAVLSLGCSLRKLSVKNCPQLTDAGLRALATLSPGLVQVTLARCPAAGSGALELGRACGRTLRCFHQRQCGADLGRHFLAGLLEARKHPPLQTFSSDSVSMADLCSLLATRPGLLSSLKGLWIGRQGAEAEPGGAALTAIATSCPALESLQFRGSMSKCAASALSLFCPSLRSIKVGSVRGHEMALQHLVKLPLASLSVKGSAQGALAPHLAQCSATMAKLSLGSAAEPMALSVDLAAAIAALGALRKLRLICSLSFNTQPAAVSELAKCRPLSSLTLGGVPLSEGLLGGLACSALKSLTLKSLAVTDSLLVALRTERLQCLRLAQCAGYSTGIANLLGRAPGLRELTIRDSTAAASDSVVAAALPHMARMPQLRILRLSLPDMSDSGAMMLAMACGGLEHLQLSSQAATSVGISSALAAAQRVRSCAFSPDGSRVVSASYDKTLKLWEAGSGSLIATLTGHTRHVVCCAISPDGTRVVSGSKDNTLCLWDIGDSCGPLTLSRRLCAELGALQTDRDKLNESAERAALHLRQRTDAVEMARASAENEKVIIEQLENRLQEHRNRYNELLQGVEEMAKQKSRAEAKCAEVHRRAQVATQRQTVVAKQIQKACQRALCLSSALARRDLRAITPETMGDVLSELGLGVLAGAFADQKMTGDAAVESTTEELLCLGLLFLTDCKHLQHALRTVEACGTLHVSRTDIESRRGNAGLSGAETEALQVAEWTTEQVAQWLTSRCAVERAEPGFFGIKGEHLLHLDAMDLQRLGVSALGDRKRVAREIKQLRDSHFAVLKRLFQESPVTRLRTLCRDPRFWGALRVFGDRQALLLTRAPYLSGATTSLEDAALCSAVLFLGCSLRKLSAKNCPQLTDAGLHALATLSPGLVQIALARCPVGISGALELGRACGRTLRCFHQCQCGADLGRHFLTGLLEARQPLPLMTFSSDSMPMADLCSTLATREAEPGGAALTAIATCCPALESLQFRGSITTCAASALSLFCPSLHSIKVGSIRGHEMALQYLVKLPLASLSVKGSAQSALSPYLAQCSATMTKLSLGSAAEPVALSVDLAAAIAALGALRKLRLICSRSSNTQPAAVSELAKCRPLSSLTLAGVPLPEDLFGGPACSALKSLTLKSLAVTDSLLVALRTERLQCLSLVQCTAYSTGIAMLLGRAPGLRELTIRDSTAAASDSVVAAVVPHMARMPQLRILRLSLPDMSDSGAMMLAMVCRGLEHLQLSSQAATTIGISSALCAAQRARVVNIAGCTQVDAGQRCSFCRSYAPKDLHRCVVCGSAACSPCIYAGCMYKRLSGYKCLECIGKPSRGPRPSEVAIDARDMCSA
eukprot:m51a1_g7957 hypothetical protein (1798) ;mRNA; r:195815-207005